MREPALNLETGDSIMKNTFMLKRIAVITLVLFSLLVIIDFLPDSEAKPKSPLEGKEPTPIVDPTETSLTPDLPSLPEFDIEPDSGGCTSAGCIELDFGARVSTPISGGCDSDGCNSGDGDAIGVFAGYSFTSESGDFQTRFDLEMKAYENGRRTVGFTWTMQFK